MCCLLLKNVKLWQNVHNTRFPSSTGFGGWLPELNVFTSCSSSPEVFLSCRMETLYLLDKSPLSVSSRKPFCSLFLGSAIFLGLGNSLIIPVRRDLSPRTSDPVPSFATASAVVHSGFILVHVMLVFFSSAPEAPSSFLRLPVCPRQLTGELFAWVPLFADLTRRL